jgi:AraC family transcriptional regulator, arabinose operon regulatory protein
MPHIDKLLSKKDNLLQPRSIFFGLIRYKPAATYGPRVQEHYQLVLVLKGHVRVYIDKQPQVVKQGEVALLKPGHHEFFEFAKDQETEHSWCSFYWQLDDELTHILETLPFKVGLSERMQQFVALGVGVMQDHSALTPLMSHLAGAVFWEFVSLAATTSSSSPYAKLSKPLQRVLSFVMTNYQHELTLEQLSEVARVTPKHLTRLFHTYLGITPMRYVWQVRSQQGASLLRHTDFTVEKIALSCGFKTVAHFSRTIKKHYQQTPLEVRMLHWQRSKEENDEAR